MSLPSKLIRPSSGVSSPDNWPISVVLPAPFGPMMACNSPRGTSSVMLSDATTPPTRLRNPSTRRRASATAHLHQQSIDAAAREQHDQQEQRPDDDLPVFGDARERFLQRQENHGTDYRPEYSAHSAEHSHDDQIAGTRPVH